MQYPLYPYYTSRLDTFESLFCLFPMHLAKKESLDAYVKRNDFFVLGK